MILFLWLAVFGFCASVVVHGSTFLRDAALGMNRAWPLHVGIFLVFIPAVLSLRKGAAGSRKESLREQYPHVPRWMLPPLAALFVYAIVNFSVGVMLVTARTPGKIVERDGQYLVMNKGTVVRPATEAEYRKYHTRAVRLFSGHWMLFYWASAVGLMDGLRRRKAEASAIRSSPQLLRPKDHNYTLRASPRLGPWSHATLLVFVRVVCCFGFFLAVAFAAVPLANQPDPGVLKSLGWVGALLVLPAALFGAVVPARWLARRLPARCPFCNGWAYCDGATTSGRGAYNFTYACRGCGRVFRPDGSPA